MILLEIRSDPSPLLLQAAPQAFSEALAAIFKSIPGLTWRKSANAYIGDSEGIRAAAALCEEAKVAKLQWRLSGVEDYPSFSPILVRMNLDERLLPYQRDGVFWLTQAFEQVGAALLADDMGLGKTPQAIASLDAYLAPEAARIIIAPAVTVTNWRAEVRRWSKNPDPYFVYSYEEFRAALKLQSPKKRAGKAPLLPPPRNAAAIVFDEAHYLSNARSKRSDAISDFCSQNKGMIRLALSGTPMTARPRDLWHILNLLFPGRFGSFFSFCKRYADGHHQTLKLQNGEERQIFKSDGASNLEELQRRLSQFMLRRVKSEVALQLPERRRISVEVELPAKVRKAMREAARGAELAMSLSDFSRAPSLASLLSHCEEFKIDAAIELAQQALASGSNPLLLTTRKATAEALSAALGVPLADGSLEPGKRAEVLKGAAAGAVSTIYACTTGLTLTNFDVMIFVGLDWVPSTLLQAEARIHRIGATRSVTFYYIVALESIDEIVRSRIIDRLETFNAAIGSEDSALTGDLRGVSDEELLKAFAASI